jgi:hypothetical protein
MSRSRIQIVAETESGGNRYFPHSMVATAEREADVDPAPGS